MTDFEKFRLSLTENLQDTSNYRVRRLWELFGKPKNAQEAVNRGAYDIDPDNKLHAYSVSPIPNENGEYEFLKPKTHNTIGYEITPYILDPEHPYHNKEMILDWTKDVPVYRNRRIYEKGFPAGAYVGNIPNKTLMAGWNYMLGLSNYFDYFKNNMPDFNMYLKMLLHDMQGNPTASRMLNKDKRRLTFNIPPYKPQTGNVYVSSYGNLVTPQIQDRNGQLTFIDNIWSPENDYPSYQQSLKFSTPEEAQYFAENYKRIAPMMQEQWDGNKVYNYFDYFK